MTGAARQRIMAAVTRQGTIIRWSMLPDARAGLAAAMRAAGYVRSERIFIEWPHLREACVRLSALTVGEIMPDETGTSSLLARCLRAGADACEEAGARDGRDQVAVFVRAVSARAASGLLSCTVWLHLGGMLRRWEPMESGLLEAIDAHRARAMEISPEPHPMLGSRDARLVIASRIFTLRDLVKAGIADASMVARA